MKWTKQEQDDFIATYEFWVWASLKRNAKCNKGEWPEFHRIEPLNSWCAFCEYFCCRECPLSIRYCNNSTVSPTPYYYKWANGEQPTKYARLIRDKIKRWLIKQGIPVTSYQKWKQNRTDAMAGTTKVYDVSYKAYLKVRKAMKEETDISVTQLDFTNLPRGKGNH